MGYRLTKIYTKTGDSGTTGLGSNERIGKDSLRIQAIGDIDELNSFLGLAAEAMPTDSRFLVYLRQIQHDLFDLGSELSMPGHSLLDEAVVNELEQNIDKLNESLPPLENFILPGGNESNARLHVARSVCRRAERTVVTFNQQTDDRPHKLAQTYLNRLSDYLFVLSRAVIKPQEDNEVLWRSRHKR